MKARHRKQRAKRGGTDQPPRRPSRPLSHEGEPLACSSRPKTRAKHLGKVHGQQPMQRADRKPRRTDGRSDKELGSHDLARLARKQRPFNSEKAADTTRAAVKQRRAAKGLGGGSGFGPGDAPAANDNQLLEDQLRDSIANWRAGDYPHWRRDIANANNRIRVIPIPPPGGGE
jgi:hypothetical protein